jgi:predicted AAA+ superfamily ATPase
MMLANDELVTVLARFNPWWRDESVPELPSWRRAAFGELLGWTTSPPAARAVLLSGARQVGKTTLMLQAVEALLAAGAPAANVLYVTFDHPMLKLTGIDAVLDAWRAREPKADGPEYLFLDEVQYVADWGTWVKHQVDFHKDRRIVFSGSAMPLVETGQESGVGRWHTIALATLSFYEYLQIKKLSLPALPQVGEPGELFDFSPADFLRVREAASAYVGHFHEYLLRGGFPQTARMEGIEAAQRLLREDILDKALKRDMTAIFGVRRVLALEQTFLYLCMHDGGLLDMADLCANLEVKRPTAANFIELLVAAHLLYRLPPYGYGKEVLRGRFKLYLADAAIAPAVLLKGKSLLEDAAALGVAAETAVFKHLLARHAAENVRFSYWRGKKDREVDLVMESGGEIVPFEVKYRAQHTAAADLKGLLELCAQKRLPRAYVVTKSLADCGEMESSAPTRIMRIPAPLLCYWAGAAQAAVGGN